MITKEIQKVLKEQQDKSYMELQKKIIPGSKEIIGVRTPFLRNYAKELSKKEDIEVFLSDLPHSYFEEDQLHSFIISLTKDYSKCIGQVNAFLPFVNNWATCDQMSPKIFRKNKKELIKEINKWLKSKDTYTVRFGIKMLMDHFLDEDFDIRYVEKVAKIRSDEYYINMMTAWYFATALAKQYDAVIPFIENKKLDTWTHNKAIQKSVESYRIEDGQKAYLKALKIRPGT